LMDVVGGKITINLKEML